MNIAILVYDISLTGGAERVALNLANELNEYYNTSIVSIFNKNEYYNDQNIVFLSNEVKSISLSFFRLSLKLNKYLKSNKIDVLLSVTAGVVTLAVVGALGSKTKVLYSEHSNLDNRTYGKKHRIRQWIGAKRSNVIVTLTERDRVNFHKQFRIALDKIVVIPNWCEETIHEQKDYKYNSKKFLSVGRLEYVKGYDNLLRVATLVKQKHADWHWDVYGEGSLHKELQNMINGLGLEDFVTLKGNVDNIDELYEEYAFLVMTSRYEGLPMTLLEAQNHSLPIVSFDCPTGPAEIVSHEINGYLIEPNNVKEMSLAIDNLIDSIDKRVYFSKNAKINMDYYSKAAVVEKWIKLIDGFEEERDK